MKRLPWPISSPLALLFRLFFPSTLVGAANPLVSAVSPQIRSGHNAERYKGAYTGPIGKIETPNKPPANSEELAKELWEGTEAVCKALVLG